MLALTFVLLLACSLSCALPFASAYPIPDLHRHALSIDGTPEGYVTNPSDILGHENGNCATMKANSSYPEAIIRAQMDGWSIGKIWVNCAKYDDQATSFGIMVYTSISQDGPWNLVGTLWVTSTTIQPIEIGTYSEGYPWGDDPPEGYSPGFTHVKLRVVSTDNNFVAYAKIDSVIAESMYSITPPPSGFPISINLQDGNGNPVPGDIYLDGYLVGTTSMTITLPFWYDTGHYYQLYVVPYDSSHVFQCYTSSMGDYTTDNPVYFRVISPAGITAHFS